MIDEKSKFRLVRRPVRGTVKHETEKQNVGRGRSGGLAKECAGQETDDENQLEERSRPGKQRRGWKPDRADRRDGLLHPKKLERHRHREHGGKDEPGKENTDLRGT